MSKTRKRPKRRARVLPNVTDNGRKGFSWTARTHQAAALVADDHLSDYQIAKRLGVAKMTLERWKRRPEFRQRVVELVAKLEEKSEQYAIYHRLLRVEQLDQRWQQMLDVIRQRAADPDHRKAPGGNTGLLVRTVKMIGAGDTAQRVEEFTFDAALVRELREHEKQAAQEFGQFKEIHEHTGPRGERLLTWEEMSAAAARHARALAAQHAQTTNDNGREGADGQQ
jgi:hypothetical protein